MRERGPRPGRQLRGLRWTPRNKALPVRRGLGPAPTPTPPQEGPLAGLGPEAGGREGSCSPVSGFFPGFLPEDLVESSSQEDPSLSPGQARTVPVMG